MTGFVIAVFLVLVLGVPTVVGLGVIPRNKEKQ